MTHVLFVQTGDYAEAYMRFKNGGAETYRDQRASVDWVEALSQTCSVTVLTIANQETVDRQTDTQLTPGRIIAFSLVGLCVHRQRIPRDELVELATAQLLGALHSPVPN